ncbi:MAG: COG3014 family protein, partial [Nitrospiraceae bacterium]
KAFLVNDTELPYEGEPYEQVMLNVLKAINYAVLGSWNEALVEARRIDHRLNLLSDRVGEKDAYRDDAFARYLSGILYEVAGDVNNAFIAYRKAYEAYRADASWFRTPVPPMLREDLLRTTDALHLSEEHEEYRRAFADVSWRTLSDTQRLAHVVVISYNGEAPRKEDQFIDLPISLDALNLVLLTKRFGGSNNPENRAAESLLYGLNGHVVRVALPRLVSQKTQAAAGEVRMTGMSEAFSARTELVQNLTALAEKSLAERFPVIAVRAVARAAIKQTLATGVGRGAQAAAGKDIGPLVGVLVGVLARSFAIASEEADKRSWRTLPGEVQLARLWVPPGEYELRIRSVDRGGSLMGQESVQAVTVRAGESRFYTVRVLP